MELAGVKQAKNLCIAAQSWTSWTMLNKVEQSWTKLNKVEQSWTKLNKVEQRWTKLNKDEQSWTKVRIVPKVDNHYIW